MDEPISKKLKDWLDGVRINAKPPNEIVVISGAGNIVLWADEIVGKSDEELYEFIQSRLQQNLNDKTN
jgi:hypothetical protein